LCFGFSTRTPSAASPSKVQADISMATEGARKVGVGVWSGVKSLLKESNTVRAPSTHSPAAHLNLPADKITVRREVSARPIADYGSGGAFLGSGTDVMFAVSSPLDTSLASALKREIGEARPSSRSGLGSPPLIVEIPRVKLEFDGALLGLLP
ncbi:hypothetical protein FRC11_010737, partial [Ceratobasidium sp. 423]